MVDLQGMRKVSPAIDLNYFLYSSFNGPDRKPNMEVFLKTYYESFCEVLKEGKMAIPFTLEKLHVEFKRRMIFGCFTGIFLVPVVLSESEDIMSIEDMNLDKMDEFTKERQETLIRMSERSGGLVRPRLLDMFDEMVEAGVID